MSNLIKKIEQSVLADNKILILGLYKPIIQSILDFDYLAGREPSIAGIWAGREGYEKFFWGSKEILLPVYKKAEQIPDKKRIFAAVNLFSSRRVLESVQSLLKNFPNIYLISVFAEGVPERRALKLSLEAQERVIFIIGPASIGIVLPGILKLGAIGGVMPEQIYKAGLYERGRMAVLSASGGMTNEIINIVARSGAGVSFSASFGGDRFPVFSPRAAFEAAEADENTKVIVYYGELGGYDEYELIQMKEKGLIRKPTICYIAGVVADIFPSSPQFGHAKAKAEDKRESAKYKRKALAKAGFLVPDSFSEFVKIINDYAKEKK